MIIISRVHGDVFRPPSGKNGLAALIGSGVQLFLMSFIVIGIEIKKKFSNEFIKSILVFAAFGMLSPSSRGALVTAACFLYVFMG